MNIEEIRTYCLKKAGSSESFPFDETTLVFKVCDKMFALLSLDESPSLNLKCDPDRAIELRETHRSITPGYHMNKKHWNTIDFEQTNDQLVRELIDHSFELVAKKLTKKQKDALKG